MDTIQELAEKRQVLAAATFRFASPLQGLREHALDQIFVKMLYDLDDIGYVGLDEILENYRIVRRGGYLPRDAALQSLSRLCRKGEIETLSREEDGYRLASRKRKFFQRAEENVDFQLTQLLCRLFNCAPAAAKRYEQPFLAVITRVAAQLGDESASQLVNGGTGFSSDPKLIDRAVEEVTGHFRGFNSDQFRHGVIEFFRSSDPACHRLLWQLAESYFVTRLIGIDPLGRALSVELFQETEYVLDTNTILAALLESHDNHNEVKTVLKAIHELHIPVLIAEITLDELNSVLDHQYEYLKRIVERGEARWLGRLDSPFLREYDASIPTTPDHFFSRFETIVETMEQEWGAKVVHADFSRPTRQVNEFARKLQTKYQPNGFADRTKGSHVAFHDASIITYIIEQKMQTARNLWLLTLDSSLPGSVPENSEWTSVAIAPRNVIQWLAPVVVGASSTEAFASVFAEMVQSRYLPRSQFLSTSDFVMLLDVQDNWSQVPADDVEAILARLKANASQLDTSRAEDRERLTALVSGTLSDKNSRTQQRIREAEQDKADLQCCLEEVQKSNATELERERQARVEAERRRQRSEGYSRFWITVVVCVGVSLGIAWQLEGYLVSTFDQLKSTTSWFLALVVSGSGLLLLLRQLVLRKIVGEDRLEVMPAPYQKFLGD